MSSGSVLSPVPDHLLCPGRWNSVFKAPLKQVPKFGENVTQIPFSRNTQKDRKLLALCHASAGLRQRSQYQLKVLYVFTFTFYLGLDAFLQRGHTQPLGSKVGQGRVQRRAVFACLEFIVLSRAETEELVGISQVRC